MRLPWLTILMSIDFASLGLCCGRRDELLITELRWSHPLAEIAGPLMNRTLRQAAPFALLLPLLLPVTLLAADWPTYRGNSARTGNIDGQAGPTAAKVLWVHHAKDHFVGSLSTDGNAIYLSGLGAFNTSSVYALSPEPGVAKRVLWAKSPPVLKLPVVSSVTASQGDLIFGDGMHQTDGAVLRCVASDGQPIWQMTVPGELVHIEGAATVSEGRVYIGAGHAGVFCVDPSVLIIDGKEMSRAAALANIAEQWKRLHAKYEDEKKKDPDFAVPPSEDQLNKPAPKVVWHKGAGQWHVDAPIAVDGSRVLVSTAFLDKEQKGKRALLCLKASDGTVDWELPLAANPWGGATIAGGKAYLGTSNVGMYLNLIHAAKGEVLAVNLSDGSVAWKKPVKGGVIAPITVQNDLAIFTATDGKVRAFDVTTGNSKWLYDGGAPFYAGLTTSKDMAYTADIKGVVHAISLTAAPGTAAWKLDLTADANVKLPAGGKVYGSPLLHKNRLYLATCNIESSDGGQQMAVVCIGEK